MREKLELRTKKSAVILTACAPVALSVLPVLAISLLLLPPSFTLMILGLMIAACSLTMAFYIPSYLGSYAFQPATNLHGARIVANLGRANTYEVSGVSAQDILVKQTFIEKRLRVCHIRVKGTAYYFRGVPEMEKVQAWVTANFPEKSKVEQRMESKGNKQKKRKKQKVAPHGGNDLFCSLRNLGEEQLGGAPAGAQSYWQGRFAACAFAGGFLGIGRTRNSWGVAPNPSRDAVPAPCKGHCPLTLFRD